jgi:hypothetical protein
MSRLLALLLLVFSAALLVRFGSDGATATASPAAIPSALAPASPALSPATLGVCHCEATESFSGSGSCACSWTVNNIVKTEGNCTIIVCTPASTCGLTADVTWNEVPPAIPPASCNGVKDSLVIRTGCNTSGQASSACVGGGATVTVQLVCAQCTPG